MEKTGFYQSIIRNFQVYFDIYIDRSILLVFPTAFLVSTLSIHTLAMLLILSLKLCDDAKKEGPDRKVKFLGALKKRVLAGWIAVEKLPKHC